MKNVIVIIKNAWGESPPPKSKPALSPIFVIGEEKLSDESRLLLPAKGIGRIYSHERMAFHYFAFAELYLC